MRRGHNAWAQPDGSLQATCSSEYVCVHMNSHTCNPASIYLLIWKHTRRQSHKHWHASSFTRAQTCTLLHRRDFTCNRTQPWQLHSHIHSVVHNASCVTTRLSHMIELATVKFCGFLLSRYNTETDGPIFLAFSRFEINARELHGNPVLGLHPFIHHSANID